MTKKIKTEYFLNISTTFLILSILTILSIWLNFFFVDRFNSVAIQATIFLILTISFFFYKVLNIRSQIHLINISYNTSTVLESLRSAKNKFIKEYRKEATISCIGVGALTSFANVLLIDNTDLSEFSIYSLAGFIMMFSFFYLISLPWLSKLIYRKRFSGIISDIDNAIKELDLDN